MAATVFILDESRRWFVEEGRIDPMTREMYRQGDRVVVCRSCKMVSLATTWEDCGGCTAPGCGGKSTADKFLKAPPPKPQVDMAAINHIILRNGRVERQEPSSSTEGDGAPQLIIKKRYFYS